MKRWGLILAFLLLAVRAQAQVVNGGGGSSSGGGTNITAGAGDFNACTQTGASLNCTVVNSQGNALTSSAFGATLNLSTLLSQDCTVSGAGVVTCTKAGNGTGTFTAGKGVFGNSSLADPAIQLTNSSAAQSCMFMNGTSNSFCETNGGGAAMIFSPGGVTRLSIFNSSGVVQTSSAGFDINGDNTVTSLARMPLAFNEGSDTTLSANESLGTFLTPKAITIENIILDIKESPTWSVSRSLVTTAELRQGPAPPVRLRRL